MHILWSILHFAGAVTLVSTITIAVHEAGHLLAGRVVGLRWKSCAVGILCVSHDRGRWRVSLSNHWSGGLVSFVPSKKRLKRRQRAIMLLGGVAANFLLGAFLIAYILRQPLQVQETQDNPGWLGSIAFLSLLSAVLNLFPFQTKYPRLTSDGLQLWRLLRGGKEWQLYCAQWDRVDALKSLYAAAKSGIRPREWDATQVRLATALQDGSANEATAAHFAFYWAVDSDADPEWGRHIDNALALLDTLSDAMQVQVLLDAAYHQGLHKRDGEAARRLIERAEAIDSPKVGDENLRRSMTLRSEAAALLAEGHPCEASAIAHEAMAVLSASPANNIADQSLTELLISRCSEAADVQGFLNTCE